MPVIKKLWLTVVISTFVISSTYANAETLKKYATVCRTKEQFKEIAANRNDKAYVLKMLQAGKCKMLLSDAVVPVQHLEGVLPLIKIKMKWGDEIFIGWTDTTMVN